MTKNNQKIEARLCKIETELAELSSTIRERDKKPWYQRVVGQFADDPVHREIVRLGRQIRKGRIDS